jgi:cytochrome P450
LASFYGFRERSNADSHRSTEYKAKHVANSIRQQIDNIINERKIALQEGGDSSELDMLSFLLSNIDKQTESLTDNEIEENIPLLLYEGHDTNNYTFTT